MLGSLFQTLNHTDAEVSYAPKHTAGLKKKKEKKTCSQETVTHRNLAPLAQVCAYGPHESGRTRGMSQ